MTATTNEKHVNAYLLKLSHVINVGFWETATYPSPNSTLTLLTKEKNVGLGEG